MNKIIFSEKLKYLRLKENLSQSQLAKKAGITRQALSKYELGISEPNLYTLVKLADYFNCSLDSLVFDTIQLNNTMINLDLDYLLNELDSIQKTNHLLNTKLNNLKSLIHSIETTSSNKQTQTLDEYLSDSAKIEVEYISIPEFSCIACGSPIEPENDIEDFIDLPLIPPLNPDKISSYFVVTASGESMNEICQHGEKIVLMSLQASCSDIKSGDILAISIDNCLTLKELILNSNHDMVTLKPHSTDPEFVETTYTCKEFKTLEIKGKFICTVNELYDKAEELSK